MLTLYKCIFGDLRAYLEKELATIKENMVLCMVARKVTTNRGSQKVEIPKHKTYNGSRITKDIDNFL